MNILKILLFILLMSGLIYAQDINTDQDYVAGQSVTYSSVNWSPIIDAAGDWCADGDFPAVPTATYFQASAWLGDTLYLHAPVGSTPTTTIYNYTYGGSWTTGVPLPIALTGGTLTACNGKLYYFGGGTAGITTGSTSAYAYDPTTGIWSAVASLPVALSAQGAVCWGDSVIFLVGGPYSGSGTNLDVHYYRVTSNTWGTITNSLPAGQGRRTFACGLVNGNEIMIGAGYNTAYLKTVYKGTIGSDASQITWTQMPDVPTGYAGLSRPGGTGIFNYFFVVGGERSGGGYHDSAYVFDATSNLWVDVIAPKPNPTSNIFNAVTATAFDDSIRLFVPGGYNGSGFANFDVVACGALLVIPVELTSFSALVNDNNVTLMWETATEVNNSGFEIERKSTLNYEVVGFVPGFGTTTEPKSYSFLETNLAPGNYSYKLKQIDYNGTYKYSNSIEVIVTTPAKYSLDQNYPNPFNPSTVIKFGLAVDSKVTLTVYDLLGQEVATLLNGNLSAGSHKFEFNASKLNSGVYFYRINATGVDGTNYSSVRKMILTK